MQVAQPLLISALKQNLGSLAFSFAMSMPITSPNVWAMARPWSWCSNGIFLKLTNVGNAKLLGLPGLNPSAQLWTMHVPHLDLNRVSINALWNVSLLSPLSKKYHLNTFLKNVRVPHLNSSFRVWIHNLIAWGGGLGPTNFPIRSLSFNYAMHANNIPMLILNWMTSFLTIKLLKLLSNFNESISPHYFLSRLRSPPESVDLLPPLLRSPCLPSRHHIVALPGYPPSISSIIGLNRVSIPKRTLDAKTSISNSLDMVLAPSHPHF